MSSSPSDTSRSTHKPGGFSGIRRNRPSYSCEICRSRRVKCDLVHPQCGSCSRTGTTCVYPNTTQKRKSTLECGADEDSSRSPRRKTTDSNKLPGSPLYQEDGHSNNADYSLWVSVELDGLERDSRWGNIPISPLEQTRFSSTDGSEGLTRSTTLACMSYISIPKGGKNKEDLATLLARLPARKTCDYLYSVFLCTVQPMIPYMHVPTFDQNYHRFWAWFENWNFIDPPNGVLTENPGFLPLLSAVLYAGSLGEPWLGVNHHFPPSEVDSDLFLNMTSDALIMANFPSSRTMYSLMAFLLIQLNHQTPSTCSGIAVAIRVAQAMGLHRDGAAHGLDLVTTEERRRVWAHIIHLDVLTSRVSFLPPLVAHDGLSDTKPISTLRDEFVGVGLGPDKRNDSRYCFPSYIFVKARYEISSCMRNILTRQHSPQPLSTKDIEQLKDMIDHLSARVEQYILRIRNLQIREPLQFSTPAIATTQALVLSQLHQNANAFKTFAENALRFSVTQVYCVLYTSTMKDVSMWNDLRSEAIPHLQANLQQFIHMLSPTAYRPFQLLYPGYNQPLQPAAVLIVDVYRQPDSPESFESCRLIEEIFTILESTAQYVGRMQRPNTSMPAWARLEKLKKDVWTKLGFDAASMPWSASLKGTPDMEGFETLMGTPQKDAFSMPLIEWEQSAAASSMNQAFITSPMYPAPFSNAGYPSLITPPQAAAYNDNAVPGFREADFNSSSWMPEYGFEGNDRAY